MEKYRIYLEKYFKSDINYVKDNNYIKVKLDFYDI